jgi:hypothetical protein
MMPENARLMCVAWRYIFQTVILWTGTDNSGKQIAASCIAHVCMQDMRKRGLLHVA